MMPDLRPAQYGTSMHYPYCIDGACTGCLPPLPAWMESEADPVVKYDGAGQPVWASQLPGNRAQRRAAAREARRRSSP